MSAPNLLAPLTDDTELCLFSFHLDCLLQKLFINQSLGAVQSSDSRPLSLYQTLASRGNIECCTSESRESACIQSYCNGIISQHPGAFQTPRWLTTQASGVPARERHNDPLCIMYLTQHLKSTSISRRSLPARVSGSFNGNMPSYTSWRFPRAVRLSPTALLRDTHVPPLIGTPMLYQHDQQSDHF